MAMRTATFLALLAPALLASGRASPSPAPVTLEELRAAVMAKLPDVREFREMRAAVRDLGIPRAYLFGGPAATFAHYVREDLERERKGLPDIGRAVRL